MSEGTPDRRIISAKTSSQKNKNKDEPQKKMTRNKMNPWLLFNCIPIIIVLCALLTYLMNTDLKERMKPFEDTSHALTTHYYFFENQMPPLKIYVYNESEPDQNDVIMRMFGSNPPTGERAFDQSEEVIMMRTLQNTQNSFLIEKDPEKADIFYAPFVLSISAMMCRASYKREFYYYYKPLLDSMGPYFERYGGIDHSLIQMSPAYNIRAPISANNYKTIAFMATMSDIPYQLSDRELWHFTQQFHGSMAPLYDDDVENETYEIDSNLNPNKRPISIFFLGHLKMFWDSHSTRIRYSLASQMDEIPMAFSLGINDGDTASLSLHANKYESMRKSQLCLNPPEDPPTSRTLTESFLSMCVPIVFSDYAYFPFEDVFIDYSKIVFQVPMDSTHLLKSAVNKANFRKIKNSRTLMREIGHLWEDNKQFEIVNGSNFWGWLWMQFFQNAIVVSSKRRYPNLLPEYNFDTI